MNSCILMAKIIRTPELRYTQDNQTPFAQMLVELEGLRAEDSAATLKAIGWGSLATEIAETYVEGDQVILEGRLEMRNIDRPEGFKEKRAQLVISHLYRVDGSLTPSHPTSASSREDNVVAINDFKSKPAVPSDVTPADSQSAPAPNDSDLDDIPF